MSDSTGFLKRVVGRHGEFLVLPKDVYIGRSLEAYGEWCEGEVKLFAQLEKKGSVVLEIGANLGSHTVPLAGFVGDAGTVFAVEMQPFVAQILSANVLLNGCSQVRVLLAGVSDTAGHLDVPTIRYGAEYNFGGISMDFLQSVEKKSDRMRVQVGPMDELVALKRLDFLKLDVEGFELAALQGGAGLIGHHRPVIYLENDDPEASGALLDFLHGHGYRAFWHRSTLFNPDNFAGNAKNIFGKTRCVNILAMPGKTAVKGLVEALDARSHPKLAGK